MKIVINIDYGGFGLSNTAIKKLIEWGKFTNKEDVQKLCDTDRSNLSLVRVVEELGDKANGFCSTLGIVEIPDDVEFVIEEYDGWEHVAEKHRTWGNHD